MPDQSATQCIWQSIAIFLGGGFIGTILGHFLAIGRDARNRKHASEIARKSRITGFKGFMSGFRSWAERSSLGQLGDEFSARVHEFRLEAAKIIEDVPEGKGKGFNEAVVSICRRTSANVAEYTVENGRTAQVGRNRLTEAIDHVVRLLD